MTLFQVEELTSYWAQHPPLHLLVAAFLGLGKDKQKQLPSTPAQRGQQTGSDAMLAELGTGFSARDVHTGLSPVVLDFAELSRRAVTRD
jgi:hypothetical protein